MPGMTAVIDIPNECRFIVEASIGTQATGFYTGEPTNATDSGPVTLTVRDNRNRTTVVEFPSLEWVDTVVNALSRATRVADTRDYTLDKPSDQETP